MIKAIIFDMDGVISDTEVAQSQAESELLKKYGINLNTEEIMEKYSGVKDREWIGTLIKKFNLSINLDKLIMEKYEKLMVVKIKPMDGSVELIKNLKQNFKLALASALPPEFINLVLSELEIKDKFEVITSASELEKGKPDPQIFLLTAQRLNVNPGECLVIEDGINGMIAAKAAGMKCIGLVKTKDYKKYPADLLVTSLKDINTKIIQNLYYEDFDKIKKEILEIFQKSPLSSDTEHAEHTLECLLRLKPEADEILQISAFVHDIERGFIKWENISRKNLDITSKQYLRSHEEGGAKIIGKILKKYNFTDNSIEKVKKLVARHEEGGDDDQNLIKDADSLSFFEKFIPNFLSRALVFGKEISKKKIDWMYNRITDNKVKEMCRESYKKALKDLEVL